MTIERDLRGKDIAWYRFTETPGKVYGPRDMAFVFRTYGLRPTCEVARAGDDGQPVEPWFPATTLRARLASQAVQPKQLRRLRELGIEFDEKQIDKIGATELIELAELQLPATEEELREAAALGVDSAPSMTRAQLNRLVAPRLAEAAEDEAEAERVAFNRDDVSRLKRAGLRVDKDIDDRALSDLINQLDDYEGAVEQAREWGLLARVVPKPTSASDLVHLGQILDTWVHCVQRLDGDLLELKFHLDKAPSQKLVRELQHALFVELRSGAVSVETAEAWFFRQAAPLLGFVKKEPAPRRTANRSDDAASTISWKVWLVGAILLVILVGSML